MEHQTPDLQDKLRDILEIDSIRGAKEDGKRDVPKVVTKKPKTENVESNMTFDQLDTEGRDLLDIYQIRKYLEQSSVNKKPIYLLEKDIRQRCCR